jgi:hypothetical protein
LLIQYRGYRLTHVGLSILQWFSRLILAKNCSRIGELIFNRNPH